MLVENYITGNQMDKQSVSKLSALSLAGFLSTVRKNVDDENARTIKRLMQKGMFEELWHRAHRGADITKSTTYANVGMLAARVLNGGKPSVAFKKDLALRPMTGHIRARSEIHDDIRFILTVVKGELCLMLDNAALDSRMATVMTYDTKECVFISSDDALIDFVLEKEVAM